MEFVKRRRSNKAKDWTGVELTHGVVIEELGFYNTHSHWLVDCKHCEDNHILTVKQLRLGVWTRECPNFVAHNSKGYKCDKDKHLNKTHGISIDYYNKLLRLQDYSCAICGKHESEENRRLAVDHCHKTGVIRGLLCRACNQGLGHFMDNIYSLQIAVEYLTSPAPVTAR